MEGRQSRWGYQWETRELTARSSLQTLACVVKWKAVCADEAGLLSVFRESVAVSFGDHGVARSAMSLSGVVEPPVFAADPEQTQLGWYPQWCVFLSQILQFSDPLMHGALRNRGISAGTADNNDCFNLSRPSCHAHPTHVIGPTPLTGLQPPNKLHNVTLALCILQVWCALSMINEISSKRAMLHFLHLGGKLWLAIIACQSCFAYCLLKLPVVEDNWHTGTLKSCQQAAIDYNKRLLDGLRLTQQVDALVPMGADMSLAWALQSLPQCFCHALRLVVQSGVQAFRFKYACCQSGPHDQFWYSSNVARVAAVKQKWYHMLTLHCRQA